MVPAASPSPVPLDGRASSYSLSRSSRSPLPGPAPAELAPYLQKGGSSSAGRDKDRDRDRDRPVSIGYLSSGNIQKLQSSPIVSAAKVPDFLFRDMLRPTSLNAAGVSALKDHRKTPSVELGDYFMKDLSLPPAQSGFSGAPPPLELSFPADLPPMGLYSSTSPHAGSFTVRPSSKERISPAHSQGISGTNSKSSSNVKQALGGVAVRANGSAGSVASSASSSGGME